jgi:hypothetical protein
MPTKKKHAKVGGCEGEGGREGKGEAEGEGQIKEREISS